MGKTLWLDVGPREPDIILEQIRALIGPIDFTKDILGFIKRSTSPDYILLVMRLDFNIKGYVEEVFAGDKIIEYFRNSFAPRPFNGIPVLKRLADELIFHNSTRGIFVYSSANPYDSIGSAVLENADVTLIRISQETGSKYVLTNGNISVTKFLKSLKGLYDKMETIITQEKVQREKDPLPINWM